jgi:hypothetical protein
MKLRQLASRVKTSLKASRKSRQDMAQIRHDDQMRAARHARMDRIIAAEQPARTRRGRAASARGERGKR